MNAECIKKIVLIVCAVLFSSALSGCGRDDSLTEEDYSALVYMENTPVVDYQIPEYSPNILVDTKGYAVDCRKRAVLIGEQLADEYRIVDKGTGETVYAGPVEETDYNEEIGQYVGYALFDDFETEGEYYIESDYIGRSYSFQINANMYTDMFNEIYNDIEKDFTEGSADVDEALQMLEIYELYTDAFDDEDADTTPDVLEMLTDWTDSIDYTAIDSSEGAKYAAFLAKFSYIYQKYDIAYATDCLQRASTVFTQSRNTVQNDGDSFLALTELYRATGIYTYRTQILDYMTYFSNNSGFIDEPEYLYGAMTYMVTRQKVDVELCAFFMDALMSSGEEISGRSNDMINPINSKNNGTDEILENAAEIACANYVLDSYEYNCLLEDFGHYLMGINRSSVCFYPDDSKKMGFLFLTARLAAQEKTQ
jgi:hypothetical protein